MSIKDLDTFKQRVADELHRNILPFWFRLKTESGFLPALSDNNEPLQMPLGLIMVSRMLWTYSRAYGLYQKTEYLELAEHAKSVLLDVFEDKEHGGFIWSAQPDGSPLDTRKQCYGQAFCIYAFSEHFLACKDADSLERAMSLFSLLEEKAWEPKSGGYLETFEANWTPLEEMHLGEDDLDAPKTMNNHLHMIEGYANLLRAEGDPQVKESCRRLLRVIADRIILTDTPRFGLFYDYDWKLLDPVVSPGHDIEGSWLLWEAAEFIGDADLEEEMKTLAIAMAKLVSETGIDPKDSGVWDEFHEEHPGSENKSWWPQAEGAVGFLNAYQLSGDERYLELSEKLWSLIEDKFVNRLHGEWHWGITSDGSPMDKEKAGPWKSSYHNARACFEITHRIESIIKKANTITAS